MIAPREETTRVSRRPVITTQNNRVTLFYEKTTVVVDFDSRVVYMNGGGISMEMFTELAGAVFEKRDGEIVVHFKGEVHAHAVA